MNLVNLIILMSLSDTVVSADMTWDEATALWMNASLPWIGEEDPNA